MGSKYKNEKLTNSVFLKHLKNHSKPEIQKLASKLQKKLEKTNAPFEIEGKIPTVERFINAVILNFLRSHINPKIQKLALKLQKKLRKKKAPFSLKGRIPTVQDVFLQFSHSMIYRKHGKEIITKLELLRHFSISQECLHVY